MRVWPLAASDEERTELEQRVLLTLHHASHLRRLDFTRRGSMTDDMFDILSQHESLRRLEINGSPMYYRAEAVFQLPPRLHSLTILLPTRAIVDLLPSALHRIQPSLRAISIIGSSSSSITDTFVDALYELQLYLDSITFAGCPRLTEEPMLRLLKQQGHHLRTLALEALGTTEGFWKRVSEQVDVSQLRALKTTIDPRVALL